MKKQLPKVAAIVLTLALLLIKDVILNETTPEIQDNDTPSSSSTITTPNQEGDLSEGLPECKIIMIDCGQADSILLTSDYFNVLVDVGESRDAADIRETLDSLGINKLDMVIATHPHADHIGGMQTIVENYNIDKLIMSPVGHTSKTYEKLVASIAEQNISVEKAEVNKVYNIGDLKLTIIGPCDTYNEDLNNNSVVAIASYGEIDILLTGDAEVLAEKDYTKNLGDYNNKIEILKSGHHGSDTSSSDNLLDNINASVALISCGVGNKYGHPKAETLNKYTERGMEVYRTDIHGDITITTNGTNFVVEAEK